MKDGALERQIMEAPKSGGVTENSNDQILDSVLKIKKIRDSILRKEFILQDGSAQCDMDIQKIKTEEKMTAEVLSIMEKYKEPSSNIMKVVNLTFFGDDGKTKSTKTMELNLKEALAQRDKCMELDEICCDCDWMAPRYTVVPSLADGMHVGEVRLTCPDFEMSITGDPRPTPHDARCSAAANMILELGKKAGGKEQHDS
ncbi:hypothetical protein CFC21_072548 [Triticum aestivum]|uniref:Uncharacterized protein n=2 Tax=Triticum aestivum TaxID=4565 RepID=A0A9R1HK60_WHEAT|nr:uncharacterized protein LOC123116552 [Triticum aestivum]KAF7066593.1 hypothetical protein CFC21_072548 [Triticum aestivum]